MAKLNDTEINGTLNVSEEIQVGDNAIADFIVEQGTTNGWSWRKWNGGIAECWCTLSLTVDGWTSVTANLYYSTIKPSLTFPFVFSKVPTVSGQFNNSGAYVFTSLQAVTETACNFVFGRIAGGTDARTGNLHVYAIGAWK